MADTNIEWADKVWNPITGCTKISEGCHNCYAERMAKRLAGRFGYPKDDPFQIMFHPDRLKEPLGWKKPKRIFVCSMGDLFHTDIPFWALLDVFHLISKAYWHIFIVLTKRPEYMASYVLERALPNLWLGVSIENQQTADERIPILLNIPATKHIVSIEPMLEPVDVRYYLSRNIGIEKRPNSIRGAMLVLGKMPGIQWVIVGGETGPGARPMDPDWARAVRDECQAAGVPFFFKQMSSRKPIPEDLMIREFPV